MDFRKINFGNVGELGIADSIFPRYAILRLVGVLMIYAAAAWAQVPTIATGQYNNNRTGANINETILNTGNVNVTQFGKIANLPLDGREYGHPLYIPNVTIPQAGGNYTTNVLYVATQKNTIFAFDANTLSTTPLWKTNLGASVPSQTASGGYCPAFSAGNELGILSTPVIDTTTNTIYAVSTSPTSSGTAYEFFLNALDITTGKPKFGSPVQIQGQVTGTGYDNVDGVITLNQDARHAQRTALLLSGGNLYFGFGSCGPDADPWHGWMFSYSASTLTQNWAFNSTPNDKRGGVWQSGMGAVADSSGNIYFTTGNGDPEAMDAWSDGLVMLSPSRTTTGYEFSNWSQLSGADLDVSSVGTILVPNTDYLLVGGKMGIVTVMNVTGGALNPVQSFQATNPCPQPIQNESMCHKMRTDAFWSDGETGGYLYVWGSSSSDPINSYHFTNGTFGSSPTPASQNTSVSLGAYDAGLSISANGSTAGTGILWANAQTALYAFNAGNLAQELWSNEQNASRDGGFMFSHWVQPIVANGHVFLPWYNNDAGGLVVYGLLGTSPSPSFSLTMQQSSQPVLPAGSASYGASVAALNGFTATVSLSVKGLPTGASATFSPPSISGSGTSTLSVVTSSSTPAGTYTLTITGTSGSLTESANVSLVVQTATGVQVSLSSYYNRVGIVSDGSTFATGLDNAGFAYSANLLGGTRTYNNVSFMFGPANTNNVVSGAATITIPSGAYSTLSILAAAVNGSQSSQVFTVTYSDGTTSTFTQSMTDWGVTTTQSGETTVASMAYRDVWNGTQNSGTFALRGYSFALNSSKTVASLTLPSNSNVELVALTLTPVTQSIQVSLTSYYNREGIVTDGTTFHGGLDGQGFALSSNLLGTTASYAGYTLVFGPANALDAISTSGATIALPSGSFTKLRMLGTAVNGWQKNQTFTVTYSDGTTSTFTQSLSDWAATGNQAGETTVTSLAHRDVWNGTTNAITVSVHGYTFALTAGKTPASLTLPNNANVIVLALSLGN